MTQLQGTALNQDEGTDAPSSSSSGSRRLAMNNNKDKHTKKYGTNTYGDDTAVKPNKEPNTVDVGVLHHVEDYNYNEEENNHYGNGHDPKYEGMNKHDDDGRHSIHEGERRLEVVGDVCPDELQVVCVNGLAEVNGQSVSCAEACGNDSIVTSVFPVGYTASNGDCCTGFSPCKEFSGTICRDGSSCSGTYACYKANIGSVLRGCNGDFACAGAAQFGSIGLLKDSCHDTKSCNEAAGGASGSIGSLKDSCHGEESCNWAAFQGSIGSLEDSCNAIEACYEAAIYGSIGSVVNSCNDTKSCYEAAYYGSIGSLKDSCNANQACYEAADDGNDNIAEFYNCCNTDEQCKDATEATLPGMDNCVAPSEVSC